MKSYNIAVIGGDGTGPEVVREAVKVLDAAAVKFGLKLNYTSYDIGGERYLRTNEVLPDSILQELRKFPAILLGAIGHPDVKPGILEKGILLRTRFELEQYINLRPVKLYDERFCPLKDKKPEHIDFVVRAALRELRSVGLGIASIRHRREKARCCPISTAVKGKFTCCCIRPTTHKASTREPTRNSAG